MAGLRRTSPNVSLRRGALLRAHREWVAAYGEELSVRELAAAVGGPHRQ
ncbi:hypothetical protein OG747_48885 (plasmid) [Streptomyces sp. NBC_01384]